MLRTHHVLTAALLFIGLFFAGCAATRPPVAAAAPQRAATVAPPLQRRLRHPSRWPIRSPTSSRLSIVISRPASRSSSSATSSRRRVEFNRALDVLLESAYGARSEPRIREHFDRLVERISAFELTALAQGDGFAEKKYEPASIDDLLAHLHLPDEAPSARDQTRRWPRTSSQRTTTSTSR